MVALVVARRIGRQWRSLIVFGWILLWLGMPGAARGLAPEWTQVAGMPTSRHSLAAGEIGGRILAVGGWTPSDVVGTNEEYDPGSDSWRTRAPMPTARIASGAGVVNGKLCVLGGHLADYTISSTVEEYDPVSDAWTVRAPMPSGRERPGIGVVSGKLYAIGGWSVALNATSVVEVYNPMTDTWTTKTSMPTARDPGGMAVVNGIIYVMGGYRTGAVLNLVEAYDPATDAWSTMASMPTGVYAAAAAVVNGLIYLVGGSTWSIDYVPTVQVYDPSSNTWAAGSSLPAPRGNLGVAAVGCRIYAIGGGGAGLSVATVYRGHVLECEPPPYTGPIRVFPNSFQRGRAVRGTVKFEGIPAGAALRLYTVRGVRVWETESKGGVVEWDGKGSGGGPVSPGVYLWVVDGRGKRSTGKLVVE